MTSSPALRPYLPADRAACLALFDSNCPSHFHPSERDIYAAFLDAPGVYFVLEQGGEALGCGGVWLPGQPGSDLPEHAAGLSWGMVRHDPRGQGLGTRLTSFRLDWVREHRPEAREVRINTTQHSRSYYARLGFAQVRRLPDGFAPGFDDVLMALSLQRDGGVSQR